MEVSTTTIRVLKNKTVELVWSFDWEEELRSHVWGILCGRSREPSYNFLSLRNLSSTQNLIIEVLDENWFLQDISLPEDIYEWIIQYIQDSWDILNASDCLGFIVEVLWWKKWNRMVDDGLYSYHGVEIIKEVSSLNPWDVVSMSDGTEEWWKRCGFHYALYLGQDLFLQKLGKPWVLAISNLEQMKKLYPRLTLMVKLLLKRKKK